MFALCLVLGLVAGSFYASQGPINARLGAYMGHVLTASTISFSVGLVILFAALAVVQPALPPGRHLFGAPWWTYLGGALGAVIVFSAAFAVPKIGVAPWAAIFIMGMLCASIVLDHFGAFGQMVRPVTAIRVYGVLCLCLGTYLILRK